MKKIWIIFGVIVIVLLAAGAVYFMKDHKNTDKTQTTKQSSQTKGGDDGSVKKQQAPIVKDGVSSTQAGNIVVQEYGGTIKNIQSTKDGTTPTWDVDIQGTPQGEIVVSVKQSDGTILGMKKQDTTQ